ncbi:organic cation transporter-related family protein [Striga asiatica]|uniref:Organic cation transporter-related family protein n=1 Tax=Striga asiatica TaxID=4170 RepID=A0A5A7PY21_STRAF|nr:organic cation transporter-related family protein [Striga asiatica]
MTPQNPPTTPPAAAPAAAKHHPCPLDDAIEHYIGDINRTQISHFALVSFAWFFDAQQNFITIFTDAFPKWSCTKPCQVETNMCRLPETSWSWDSPACTSTVSQWSLQCAGPIIRGLPASSFYLGCLIGGLGLATLADSRLGRKNMLALSCLVMSVFGCLSAASENIWMYAGLRFASGLGRAPIGTCAFVLGSELVGRKWRGKVGIFGFLCYALGFLSLPIVAYLLRGSSWRFMYLFTCGPCICYSVLVYFTAHESPRWLFIKGRKREFAETLKSLARSTKDLSVDYLEWTEESHEQYRFYSAVKILLKKKWAFHRLIKSTVAGFGVGLAYYGMPLGLGSLPVNLYFSVGMNALFGLLSSAALLPVIGMMRRKALMVGLCVLSGICNVAGVVLLGPNGLLKMGLELLSFIGANMAFDVLLVYVLELFPTCVRNSAVSVVREAILLGGFLGPIVVAVAANGGKGLVSYGVFGVTILTCGLFVVCLPETKGRVLCDTMDEEEETGGKRNESIVSSQSTRNLFDKRSEVELI